MSVTSSLRQVVEDRDADVCSGSGAEVGPTFAVLQRILHIQRERLVMAKMLDF
jgi:hypothetical protein